MKELVKIAVATALLIAISEVAVHRFNDRELFVPPPDAISEGFVREVVARRYDRAASYLADSGTSTSEIRALADSLEARMGRVNDVRAETIRSSQEEATVNVRLRSARVSDSLAVKTVWKNGGWRVDGVPHGA